MALNLNKILIDGRIVSDPDYKHVDNFFVSSFRLMNKRRWKDAANSWRETNCFIDVKAFNKLAEVVHAHLHRGRDCVVEGYLKLEEWDTPQGKRSKHVVVMDRFHFADPPPPRLESIDLSEELTGPGMPRPEMPRAEMPRPEMPGPEAPAAQPALVGSGT